MHEILQTSEHNICDLKKIILKFFKQKDKKIGYWSVKQFERATQQPTEQIVK